MPFSDIYKDREPSLEVTRRDRALSVAEIRNLLLWAQTESEGVLPKWAVLKQKPLLEGTLVVVFPNLDGDAFNSMPVIRNLVAQYGDPLPLSAKGNLLEDLLTHPVPARRQGNKVEDADNEEPLPDIESYLMTAEELQEGGFPSSGLPALRGKKSLDLPSKPRVPHPLQSDDLFSKMVAMDCEMCLTENGHELCRISIVDSNLDVVLDEYCKPDKEIVDYLTQFSGISESTLLHVTQSPSQLRKKVCKLLPRDSVLVGHSLENDLVALGIFHDRVLDSQRLFPHRCAPYMRNGLARLVSLHLNDHLDRKHGHDSIRDAQAAMQLTLLKLANGPQFANPRKVRIPIPLRSKPRLFGASLPGVRGVIAKDLGNDADVEEAADVQKTGKESCSVLVLRQAKGGVEDISARLLRMFKVLPARTLTILVSAKEPSCCVLPFVWDDESRHLVSSSVIADLPMKKKKGKRKVDEAQALEPVHREASKRKKAPKKTSD